MIVKNLRLYPISVERTTGFVNRHVLVGIEGSDGLTGWGEMSDLSHAPLYELDTIALERTLNELLRGRRVTELARIELDLVRAFPDEGHVYSRSGSVRQGVDLALHDLLGRVLGLSTGDLLGGALRDRIPVCFPIFRLRSTADVEPSLERVRLAVRDGFGAIRVYVGGDTSAERAFLEQLADAHGDSVTIKSLDFSNLHGWREALGLTREYAKLVSFSLVESPALRNDPNGLREFRGRSDWPVSEHVYHLAHAAELLRGQCVDILNVSPYVLGGLRPSLRAVALAEAAHASVLVGTTQELGLGTAAAAHLASVIPSLPYACDNTGPALYKEDVVLASVRYEDGALLVPDKPGLGLDVDLERLEELVRRESTMGELDITRVTDRTTSSV